MPHTPAPWYVVNNEIHDSIAKRDKDGARIGNTPSRIARVDTQDDARLIAAAPELLAALEELVAEFDVKSAQTQFGLKETGGILYARTIIAKAKG